MKYTFTILLLSFSILLALLAFQAPKNVDNFQENITVALRKVGHNLLLSNADSTSLVLPIKKIETNNYQIRFERPLSIHPDSLVSVVNSTLKDANLFKSYIVEVKRCQSEAVSYSFKINGNNEKDIVPCSGRKLQEDCYNIEILFVENESFLATNNSIIIAGTAIIGFGILAFLYFRKPKSEETHNQNNYYINLGTYRFYESQNKLEKDNKEIKLSTKECELLKLLSDNQNEIVKREILIKEIWEDNGVFVGRSLDTFISKLRKKFKSDDAINIVNIHGVGYKLEVS